MKSQTTHFEPFRRIAAEHPLLMVFCVAFVLRLFNIAHVAYSGSGFMIEDSDLYPRMAPKWLLVFGIISGDPSSVSGYSERMPLYPLFIGLMQLMELDKPLLLVLVSSLADAGTCFLIALLGFMIDKRSGIAAGLLAAAWPNLIIHSGLILTDTFFVLFLMAAIYTLVRFILRPCYHDAFLSGLFLGLAIMTRAVAQFLPPIFLLIVLAWSWRTTRNLRQTISMGLAQISIIAVLVAPVLLHNIERYSSFSLTDQTGTHLLYWVVPAVKEVEFGTPKETTIQAMRRELSLEYRDEFVRSKEKTRLALNVLADSSPAAILHASINGAILNLATPAVLADPRVRALSQQSFYELQAPSLAKKIARYVKLNGIGYAVVFLFGALGSIGTIGLSLYGFYLLWRRNRFAAIGVLLIVFYFLAINGPIGAPKYRLPFEPIIILLTVLGSLSIFDRLRAFRFSGER